MINTFKSPKNWDRTRAAARCHKKLNERMLLLSLYLNEKIQQEDYGYTPEHRKERTRKFMAELFGSPEQGYGFLQQELNAETCGILERLSQDLPNLTIVEQLVFSYSAFGLSNRVVSIILDIPNEKYVSTLRSRLRKRIERLESIYRQEYLEFMPRNSCRFGGEMLYLHNL